jgi:hypothetical protein
MSRQLTVAQQMVGAEFLRLRRKRSLIAIGLFVMVGVIAIDLAYSVIAHATNPRAYLPAGGVHNFGNTFQFLGVFLGPIAATLIGAELGAGDLAAGVFREQVVTGRSRLALFLAKVPAAVGVTLVLAGLGFVLLTGSAFMFASNLKTPSLTLVVQAAGWVALTTSLAAVIALGLGSLLGSRPATITALLAWELVIGRELVGASGLGHVRYVLLNSAFSDLTPGAQAVGIESRISMSALVAFIVLVGWAVVLPALGAWRTRTRDA